MYWYHISLSPVETFEPRVPLMTYEKEDKTIPRICVTSNLQKAFHAAPQMGNILKVLLDNEIHPVVYIYRFYQNDFKDAYLPPSKVVDYVADAIANEEYWLLKKPTRVSCRKVIVQDGLFRYMSDMFNVTEYFCCHTFFKQTKSKKTNEEILAEYFKNHKFQWYADAILESELLLRSKIRFMIEENLLKFRRNENDESENVEEK